MDPITTIDFPGGAARGTMTVKEGTMDNEYTLLQLAHARLDEARRAARQRALAHDRPGGFSVRAAAGRALIRLGRALAAPPAATRAPGLGVPRSRHA
jgi:hypothetical protein